MYGKKIFGSSRDNKDPEIKLDNPEILKNVSFYIAGKANKSDIKIGLPDTNTQMVGTNNPQVVERKIFKNCVIDGVLWFNDGDKQTCVNFDLFNRMTDFFKSTVNQIKDLMSSQHRISVQADNNYRDIKSIKININHTINDLGESQKSQELDRQNIQDVIKKMSLVRDRVNSIQLKANENEIVNIRQNVRVNEFDNLIAKHVIALQILHKETEEINKSISGLPAGIVELKRLSDHNKSVIDNFYAFQTTTIARFLEVEIQESEITKEVTNQLRGAKDTLKSYGTQITNTAKENVHLAQEIGSMNARLDGQVKLIAGASKDSKDATKVIETVMPAFNSHSKSLTALEKRLESVVDGMTEQTRMIKAQHETITDQFNEIKDLKEKVAKLNILSGIV